MVFNDQVVCIYHGNCLDGIAAAWVVWDHYSRKGEEIAMIPGVYSKPLPEGLKGKTVIIVDFSYKRDDVQWLKDNTNLILLDHHKSAKEDLNGLVEVDMSHSGAMLTWNHFHPSEEPPMELLFVEDRDLWKFKYSYTREWTSAAFSYPLTVDSFDDLINEHDRDVLCAEGRALLRKQANDVVRICESRRTITIDGVIGLVVNANYMYASDIGETYKDDWPFVVTYSDGVDCRIFSLRSGKEGGTDVAALAERFGGGGHEHAAGFKIKFTNKRFAKSHICLWSDGHRWTYIKNFLSAIFLFS
jgi:oligoribonuclease NrnB/cAMP/cGMP phosphodiesterase (DHH superfamily)